MSRRSKAQIITEILTICHGSGASKTMIAQQANLNLNTAKSYLEILTKWGLIEDIKGNFILYKTTSKVEKSLECLRKIETFYS